MTALTNTQKIEALQRAQRVLRQKGWIKYNFEEETGVCANGALAYGSGCDSAWDQAPRELLEDVVLDMPMPRHACMHPASRICEFNNEEAQTKEDVIAQFQITIDRLVRQNHPASRERELVNA
jgi:hypothetical protein